MADESAAPDAAIALVAARQHGVVASAQLQNAGLSREAIRRRTETGRLHRIHHGVYAVGHAGISREGRWLSAVLSCCGHGDVRIEGAFLSHLSAAELWNLLSPRERLIDVAIIGETGREKRTGVRVHRPRTLEVEMTTRRDGIPVTDPQRTISDLRRARPSRGGATPEQLRRAMRQAAVLGLPLSPGAKGDLTRSDLELLFLGICGHSGIPTPAVNTKIEGMEVDFLWAARDVIVETDGFRYHRGRIAFEDDHERDLRLRELGFDVLRFSEYQLTNQPSRVAAAVRHMLAAD